MLSSAGVNSGLGLSSIKLESPAYYCTSYASPPGDQDPGPGLVTTHAQLVTANYGTLSLAPARTSPSAPVNLGDNNLIRVKRMRRMSSEELREDKGQVSDLQYYTGSPLSGAATWTQSDIDQATAIGERETTFNVVLATCFCT